MTVGLAGAAFAVGFLAFTLGGSSPVAPPPTGTVRDLFGINEAVAIPSALLPSLDEAARAARLDARIALVQRLGVRHVRVHSASWPFFSYDRFDRAAGDAYLARLLAADLEPLVILGPWPGNAPAAHTDRYVPDDLDAYSAWVRETVERYDGDGVDDAPGIGRGVRAWEVDNEPDLHHTTPPRGAGRDAPVGIFQSVAEYERVAGVTFDAIGLADPGATVLPAGLWSPAGPRTRSYAVDLWTMPSFSRRFQATNVHSYPREPERVWDGEDAIERLVPARARWVTEVSTSDAGGERAQAVFLARLYLEALHRGVERVYWHSLLEPPAPSDGRRGPHPTAGHHLYRGEPPAPKLAALVMQRLIGAFGDVGRSEVEPIADGAVRIGRDLVVFQGIVDVEVDGSDRSATTEALVDFTNGVTAVHDSRVRVDATEQPVRVVEAYDER